ncbi:MAG: helix-turn-helix transcriptional regulator [Candidatus Metalachnospira sp.]|nr:helix-turn-helix transcriptional regulator [Candidatus Metalachnospira sp.]
MKTIETNDWVVVNSIIYKIYAVEDGYKMREGFLEDMKMVLDFDSADFYVASGDEEKKLINPAMYNCNEDLSELYEKSNRDIDNVFKGKSIVFRGTDIEPEEKAVNSKFYNNVCRPNNWHYTLHIVLSFNKELMGMLTFYRTVGKGNFDYDDIFLMDMLKNHLSLRLSWDRDNYDITHEKLTVSKASDKFALTKQEHMILKMLMEGMDNNAICDSLSISVNTLKKHILNIYRKLGIKNRVQMFKMIKEKE